MKDIKFYWYSENKQFNSNKTTLFIVGDNPCGAIYNDGRVQMGGHQPGLDKVEVPFWRVVERLDSGVDAKVIIQQITKYLPVVLEIQGHKVEVNGIYVKIGCKNVMKEQIKKALNALDTLGLVGLTAKYGLDFTGDKVTVEEIRQLAEFVEKA